MAKDEDIAKMLDKAGVYDQANHGFITGSFYLLNESNASNLSGKDNMDFSGNGRNNIEVEPGTMYYVTNTKADGLVAHDGRNYGNFLWGAGAKSLGVPLFPNAILGSHLNNMRNEKPKWHFDSSDDQRSIRIGYHWAEEHKRK